MSKKFVFVPLAIALISIFCLCRFFFSRPAFDPSAVESSDTKMWKACYQHDKMELGLQLVSMLRNQHGLSLLEKGILN